VPVKPPLPRACSKTPRYGMRVDLPCGFPLSLWMVLWRLSVMRGLLWLGGGLAGWIGGIGGRFERKTGFYRPSRQAGAVPSQARRSSPPIPPSWPSLLSRPLGLATDINSAGTIPAQARGIRCWDACPIAPPFRFWTAPRPQLPGARSAFLSSVLLCMYGIVNLR
jgi:hypothetical protein